MTIVGVTVAGIAFWAVSVDIAGAAPWTAGITFVDESKAGELPTGVGIAGFIMRCVGWLVLTYPGSSIGEFAGGAVYDIGIDIGFAETLGAALHGIGTKRTTKLIISVAVRGVIGVYGSIAFAVPDAVFVEDNIRIRSTNLSGSDFILRKQRIAGTVSELGAF